MTGYGSATAREAGVAVTVEARSVNSRGLKVVVKGPPGLEEAEVQLRELVRDVAQRGRVDLFVRPEEDAGDGPVRRLDEERVRHYLAGLERLQREFGVGGVPDLQTLAQLGGLFQEPDHGGPEVPRGALVSAAREALEGLVDMREKEGARLEEDLRERLAGLDSGLDAAEELAPGRLARERERLRAAVEELMEEPLEDDRLAREIALIADRWDVGEELVRARSHVAAFREYLSLESDEPVGKRLGFLVQELQREINTLGAKANDTRISGHVVEMKNEIEKLREQVENVE